MEKIYPSVPIKSQAEGSVVLNWKLTTLMIVSRIFGFRNDQRNGINRTVMGPHRKIRKRLEEYVEF